MDIHAFWQAVLSQDSAALETFFWPQAVIGWHCSNEQFTVPEFIRANCEYPGDWAGEIERVHQVGDVLITATHVHTQDGASHFHVVSFMKLREGRIETLDEYGCDEGPEPVWRQEMHIGCALREEK